MVWEAPRWAVFQGWGAPWAVAACKADGSARPPRPPRPRAEGRRLGTMCFVFLSSGTSVCPFAGELREGRGRPAGTRGGAVAAARCGAAPPSSGHLVFSRRGCGGLALVTVGQGGGGDDARPWLGLTASLSTRGRSTTSSTDTTRRSSAWPGPRTTSTLPRAAWT